MLLTWLPQSSKVPAGAVAATLPADDGTSHSAHLGVRWVNSGNLVPFLACPLRGWCWPVADDSSSMPPVLTSSCDTSGMVLANELLSALGSDGALAAAECLPILAPLVL